MRLEFIPALLTGTLTTMTEKLKLGILVNTDKNLKHLLGFVRASVLKNYDVIIFVMDSGTLLLQKKSFITLAELPEVSISLCGTSANAYDVDVNKLSKKLNVASQFENALMNHRVNRMIVL